MAERPLLKFTTAQGANGGDLNVVNDDETTRTGPVETEEKAIEERVASKIGWKPKEDWVKAGRDPERWRDAGAYLEFTPTQIETLKERNDQLEERVKRNAQASARLIEEERTRTRAEAEAEIRAAAEANEPERVIAATKKLAENAGPPPQTAAWIARNPWMETDPEANALAKAVADRLHRSGAPIDEQLEAAEAAVKKRFPEHFDAPQRREEPVVERPKPKEDVRLSESRIAPPAVSAGSRGGAGVQKEKGFDDIPAGDRALYDRHFAKRMQSRMTPELAKSRYAASYWANKEA